MISYIIGIKINNTITFYYKVKTAGFKIMLVTLSILWILEILVLHHFTLGYSEQWKDRYLKCTIIK